MSSDADDTQEFLKGIFERRRIALEKKNPCPVGRKVICDLQYKMLYGDEVDVSAVNSTADSEKILNSSQETTISKTPKADPLRDVSNSSNNSEYGGRTASERRRFEEMLQKRKFWSNLEQKTGFNVFTDKPPRFNPHITIEESEDESADEGGKEKDDTESLPPPSNSSSTESHTFAVPAIPSGSQGRLGEACSTPQNQRGQPLKALHDWDLSVVAAGTPALKNKPRRSETISCVPVNNTLPQTSTPDVATETSANESALLEVFKGPSCSSQTQNLKTAPKKPLVTAQVVPANATFTVQTAADETSMMEVSIVEQQSAQDEQNNTQERRTEPQSATFVIDTKSTERPKKKISVDDRESRAQSVIPRISESLSSILNSTTSPGMRMFAPRPAKKIRDLKSPSNIKMFKGRPSGASNGERSIVMSFVEGDSMACSGDESMADPVTDPIRLTETPKSSVRRSRLPAKKSIGPGIVETNEIAPEQTPKKVPQVPVAQNGDLEVPSALVGAPVEPSTTKRMTPASSHDNLQTPLLKNRACPHERLCAGSAKKTPAFPSTPTPGYARPTVSSLRRSHRYSAKVLINESSSMIEDANSSAEGYEPFIEVDPEEMMTDVPCKSGFRPRFAPASHSVINRMRNATLDHEPDLDFEERRRLNIQRRAGQTRVPPRPAILDVVNDTASINSNSIISAPKDSTPRTNTANENNTREPEQEQQTGAEVVVEIPQDSEAVSISQAVEIMCSEADRISLDNVDLGTYDDDDLPDASIDSAASRSLKVINPPLLSDSVCSTSTPNRAPPTIGSQGLAVHHQERHRRNINETVDTNDSAIGMDDSTGVSPSQPIVFGRVVSKDEHMNVMVLQPRKLIKPKAPSADEQGLRRSTRTRMKPVRTWLGEAPLYQNSPSGGRRLVGSSIVEVRDKYLLRNRTADLKLAVDRENDRKKQNRALKELRKRKRLADLRKRHRMGKDLNVTEESIVTSSDDEDDD